MILSLSLPRRPPSPDSLLFFLFFVGPTERTTHCRRLPSDLQPASRLATTRRRSAPPRQSRCRSNVAIRRPYRRKNANNNRGFCRSPTRISVTKGRKISGI